MYPPHTSIPKAEPGTLKSVASFATCNRNDQCESKGKTSQYKEDSSVEENESQSSEDENSEDENDSEEGNDKDVIEYENFEISESEEKCTKSISQEIDEEDGKKNANESNEKSERKNIIIPQKVTVTKEPNKIDKENVSSKEHHPTSKTISVSGHTNKTSKKKKKKKQKHIDVNEECSTITDKGLLVSDLSQSPKTSNEHLGLKGKKSLPIMNNLKQIINLMQWITLFTWDILF